MINHLCREYTLVSGLAQQLGTTWNTVRASVEPLLQAMVDDEGCFAGVKWFGVDEHVWYHVNKFPIEDGGCGPRQLTGMVGPTLDPDTGGLQARLLDLVPGRLGKA